MSELERLGAEREQAVARVAEIDEALVPHILAAHADGRSLRWIAERTGQSHQTVKNIIDRQEKQ